MEKTVSGSTNANANKDSFKNQPQANAPANDMKGSISSDAKSTVSDVKSAIVDQAAPAMNYLKDNFSAVSNRTQGYMRDAGSLVRQYPMYSILGAVAVGAFLGMAISRPSSRDI